MQEKNIELEDRFVDFTCSMIDIVQGLPDNRSGNFLASQLTRASHSPTFNYSEAQSSGSRADFIRNMEAVMKDLKECRTALKIIRKKDMVRPLAKLETVFSETEQLIAIIGKSIGTARKNRGKVELE